MDVNNYKYTFTVFTPTYNRALLIHRVYDSLCMQTYKDFEWLVVDDGSVDNTREIIESYQKEAEFSIRYIYKENAGKHRAFNLGVQEAQGKLFLAADSDDSFLANALEVLYSHWNQIPNKEIFSAVTGLCIDKNENIIGKKYPQDIFDSNSIDATFIHKIKGEKWGFQKTEVLKEFPFKEFDGEKFIAESSVWNLIASKYKTRFINESLRIYEINEDSLSSDTVALRVNNPKGVFYTYKQEFNLALPLKFRLKSMINCMRFSLYNKEMFFSCIKIQNIFLLLVTLPLGILMYLRDKIKR